MKTFSWEKKIFESNNVLYRRERNKKITMKCNLYCRNFRKCCVDKFKSFTLEKSTEASLV